MITLVDSRKARTGYEFIAYPAPGECKSCTLLKVCIGNLETGRKYRVLAPREKEHECAIFGLVRVVEVGEGSILGSLNKNKVYIGSKITYEPQSCGELFCDNSRYCIPEGLRKGDVCRIEEVLGKLECDRGLELQLVRLRREP